VNILLLSAGGGGGNILRSLKTLFARDVATAQTSDARFADRLRRAITARFIDTNEFSLSDVPRDERLLIGAATAQRFGSGHNPLVAQRALEESRDEVERLISKFAVIVIIATGGKGTGAGTAFPLAQMARAQKKLVIPIFVRPSFERHEVDKRRYDHAVEVADQFDAAGIRLMEVLNDRGYCDTDPQPQSVVWERMNVPIARGLRGLLYVLGDLSQVDPSDLSILLAGSGRMRIGFAEIDPPPEGETSDSVVDDAVRQCWRNTYYAFDRPVGTSLVCIQGEWSNLVDARIKGQLAALAATGAPAHCYTPLHARAFQTPRPWGVTTLVTEFTGVRQPLELDWVLQKRPALQPLEASPSAIAMALDREASTATAAAAVDDTPPVLTPPLPPPPDVRQPDRPLPAAGIWDLARAVNRGDRTAMAVAADVDPSPFAVDGLEVKRLLGTFWFRSVFQLFSPAWRERLFSALVSDVIVPNHQVKLGRELAQLKDLRHEQIKAIADRLLTHTDAGPDLRLLMAIGNLWGADALTRMRFGDAVNPSEPSRLATLFSGLRQ
jgi:cell division GTPase FtsZ